MALGLPQGFRSAGIPCGIKADATRDLGMIVADDPVAWAGVFTRNGAAAAPVRWSSELLGTPARAVVANSGNANACTGKRGIDDVRATATKAAAVLDCSPSQVLVASTGPIGVPLPVNKVLDGLPKLLPILDADGSDFAHSILTTDTRIKTARADAGKATVVGIAKGAAMIAPNMATMLAFVMTDAALDAVRLQRSLTPATNDSFNRISIDGCESTNDSVFLLSSGAVDVEDDLFAAALRDVCGSLAEQIVADAEGATRLLRIVVAGAADASTARDLARGVADSALWRAAAHGADPNWGRVVAALGQHAPNLDLEELSVSIGDVVVFDRGELAASLQSAARAMEPREVTVTCVVGAGPGAAEVLTADLSPSYVELNAYGTT